MHVPAAPGTTNFVSTGFVQIIVSACTAETRAPSGRLRTAAITYTVLELSHGCPAVREVY